MIPKHERELMAWLNGELRDVDAAREKRVRKALDTLAAIPGAVYTEVKDQPKAFSAFKREEDDGYMPVADSATKATPKVCCLYPEYGPFDDPPPDGGTYYPSSDLPDTLEITTIIGGTQQVFRNTTVPPDPMFPDDYYLRTYNTPDNYTYNIQMQTDYWEVTYNQSPNEGDPGGGYSKCLVGLYTLQNTPDEPFVADIFPDTLTVNGSDTITRTSAPHASGDRKPRSCMWTGAASGGGMWKLDYGQSTSFVWTLTGGGSANVKVSPQSSPVGSYGPNTVA